MVNGLQQVTVLSFFPASSLFRGSFSLRGFFFNFVGKNA